MTNKVMSKGQSTSTAAASYLHKMTLAEFAEWLSKKETEQQNQQAAKSEIEE